MSQVQLSDWRLTIRTKSFRVFSVPVKFRGSALKFGHGDFLLHPSDSSSTYCPFFRRCIVRVTEEASLNKLQIINKLSYYSYQNLYVSVQEFDVVFVGFRSRMLCNQSRTKGFSLRPALSAFSVWTY
jgi:hypothetical protein